MSRPRITFCGAAGTVTGSKTLIESAGGKRVLVDCGLFQGFKANRLKNWAELPFDPASLDAVLLTHAHIDHSGYLPRLVASGFRGPIYASDATYELCCLLLPDSGRIQENDAEYANRKGFSKHQPALPLYTEQDAHTALAQFRPVNNGHSVELGEGLAAEFRRAGHILGASIVRVSSPECSITFSGDLGRDDDLLMHPPQPLLESDYVVIESTYGQRSHTEEDLEARLAALIRPAIERGGTVIVPAFAVARTQVLLYLIRKLSLEGRIPRVPVYINSPMATSATAVYERHAHLHRLGPERCAEVCDFPEYVRLAEASKRLNEDPTPKIVISASGMATGGRVIHHLKRYLPDERSLILFTGFQAKGTRGDSLVQGADQVRIHGQYVPVRAQVASVDGLSAHADREDLVRWLGTAPRPPKRVFINHGEPSASEGLRCLIRDQLGWEALVPDYGQSFDL